MIISDLILIFSVLFGLIVDKYCFMFARLMMGFALGMNFSVVSLYIREVTPVHLTGKMGYIFQVVVIIGIITSTIFSLPLA